MSGFFVLLKSDFSIVLLSQSVISLLNIEQINPNTFYQEATNKIGFNYCFIYIKDNYVSIRAGKKDQDYERQLLKLLYIESEDYFMDILKRLHLLSFIFPQIIIIPPADKILQNA